MFQTQISPFQLTIRESCGLAFASQLVEIEIPAHAPELFWVRDAPSGRTFPIQKSRQNPARGFLQIEIEPFAEMCLEITSEGTTDEISALEHTARTLANPNLTLHLAPDCKGPLDALDVSGPVTALALNGQKTRGSSYFDARSRVLKAEGTWLESGPLRAVWAYHVEFEAGFYAATLTLDAGEQFAVIEETLGGESGAQLVWDFAGEDWPRELFLLDSTAGGTFRRLHAHFDARHARLSAWTQYQQLHDLADGFGLLLEDEVVGVVALEGGLWCGNRLNQIEAWTRRFWRDDRRTRRAEPWDAKADSMPGPDAIPARGAQVGTPHLCLESWISAENGVAGWRKFALVVAPRAALFPGADDPRCGDGAKADHFENAPDRTRYRREQSLLRQIQIQRGMLPLQTLAFKAFDWPASLAPNSEAFAYPHPLLAHHLHHHADEEVQRIEQMKQYLASRVYGFWEGGGAAHSNCVVGRVIAPELFHFEFLAHSGRLGTEETRLLRAQFAFLCHLFHSDNYYPGPATMRPNGDPDSFEPTLAGMANQNFFTDVMCVAATGAQIFPSHPDAPAWRERFSTQWRRQLEFHRYPQSGVWEESHTYFLHVLLTVLPLLLRRRDDGAEKSGEGFQDPLLHSLCASINAQLTPKHAHHNNFRHVLAWGDHQAGRHDFHVLIFGALAQAIVPYNPELAGQLAWVSEEYGGGSIEGITPRPLEWKSGPIEGLGFCFRARNDEGKESLLALRAGGAWGHHHHDDGSVQFFAHDEALIVDAAFGHSPQDGKRKFLASGHSRWSLRDLEPFNYFWRFNRGWLCAHETEGAFPYAVAWTPVTMVAQGSNAHLPMPLWPFVQHWRTIVQLAPEAFLIIDESDATLPQVVRFQLPGEVFLENGRVRSNNGNATLCLVPLTDSNTVLPVRLGVKDVPRQEGNERFATQEVVFDTELAPRSAIVVAASASLKAQREGEKWLLQDENWEVEIRFEADAIHFTHPNGESRVLNRETLRFEV